MTPPANVYPTYFASLRIFGSRKTLFCVHKARHRFETLWISDIPSGICLLLKRRFQRIYSLLNLRFHSFSPRQNPPPHLCGQPAKKLHCCKFIFLSVFGFRLFTWHSLETSTPLAWVAKKVALLLIRALVFVDFFLHLTHSWSQKLSALEVRVAKKIAPLPICGSPSPTEAWLKQRSYFRKLFTPILNFYKLSPIFNFHKLFRLTSKIFSHHKLNLKSTFLNFGQIHLSILSHLKLNFASSSFPFFAQPKHFAFLTPSIKLTLVVTTLQRW